MNPTAHTRSFAPTANLQVYDYLYQIEVGLRELIIELLCAVSGSKWYRSRLPSDILSKYQEGIKFERDSKWVQLVPHHPIYYIDFPDLRKIIQREDNWNDCFKTIFGPGKGQIDTILSELDTIRNKIAHNRKVADRDVRTAEQALEKISRAVNKPRFDELSRRCTLSQDIPSHLIKLKEEMNTAFLSCQRCEVLRRLDVWNSTRDQWWFDETYLGHGLHDIIGYFRCMEGYMALPRARGCGYKIEAWVKETQVETKRLRADKQFSALQSEWG